MMYAVYAMTFLIGAVIGSFLNVCIYRLPEGRSIAFPGSHCFSCGHALGALDLVPVFSYLFLRGRCRYCGAGVSPQYPLVELAAGMIAVLSAAAFGFTLNAALAFIFSAGLVVVFMIDLKTMLIPDEATLFLIGAAVVYRAANWRNPWGLLDMLYGLLIGSGLLLALYVFGLLVLNREVMGLGDVKLFAPIGILLGGEGTAAALYLSVLAGAAAAVCILLRVRDKKNRRMPFGPFIAAGAMASLYFGDYLIGLYWKLFGL